MKIKAIIIIAIIGIMAGIVSAQLSNKKVQPQPPLSISYNPYEKGIYATGILESRQVNGSNVNIFPEVSGKVTAIFVQDGQVLKKGAPILAIDDSVQRQIVEKDLSQIAYAEANIINVTEQLEKIRKSYEIDRKSISQNTLDNAINAVKIAEENLNVAKAQYRADKALLDKYIINSPIDGVILRVVSAQGDYISPQGTYDFNTQANLPVVQMGVVTPYLQVRCFLDEILVPQLPNTSKLEATLFVRGASQVGIPLEFLNIQPFTIPNIQLSDQRIERVDVRVLPILFKFKKPGHLNVYPGQLVDVFIKGKA